MHLVCRGSSRVREVPFPSPRIIKRDTVLKPLLLFTRLALFAQRELTLKESLQFELTPLPISLLDEKQFLRKADKSQLGTRLKKS